MVNHQIWRLCVEKFSKKKSSEGQGISRHVSVYGQDSRSDTLEICFMIDAPIEKNRENQVLKSRVVNSIHKKPPYWILLEKILGRKIHLNPLKWEENGEFIRRASK